MQPAKSKRGGTPEPLAAFNIFFPTWTTYQKGDASRYLRIERGTRHNRQLSALQPQQRWIWLALVLMAKDGWVRDITVSDVAFESHCPDYGMVRKALDAMKRLKLIIAEGDWSASTKAAPKLDQSSTEALPMLDQSSTNALPKVTQSSSKENAFGLSSNGAGFSDTEQSRTESEQSRTEGEKGIDPEAFADTSKASPSPAVVGLDPVKLIAEAMAAAQLTPWTVDPIIGYRAKAHGFLTRKPPEVDSATYATWVCMAIAAGGNCSDWEVRANAGLKESRAAGAYIAPERPRGSNGQGNPGRRLQDEFGV